MSTDFQEEWDPTKGPAKPKTVIVEGGQVREVAPQPAVFEPPKVDTPSAPGSIPTERVELVIGGKRVNVTPFDDDERKGKGYYYESGDRHVVDLSGGSAVSRPAMGERKPIGRSRNPEEYLEEKRLQALSDLAIDPNDQEAKAELARITNMQSNFNMGNREPVRLEIEKDIGETRARFEAARGSLRPIGQLPDDDKYQGLKEEIARLKASQQSTSDPLEKSGANFRILQLQSDQQATERGRIMHQINTLKQRITSLESLKSSLQ